MRAFVQLSQLFLRLIFFETNQAALGRTDLEPAVALGAFCCKILSIFADLEKATSGGNIF